MWLMKYNDKKAYSVYVTYINTVKRYVTDRLQIILSLKASYIKGGLHDAFWQFYFVL